MLLQAAEHSAWNPVLVCREPCLELGMHPGHAGLQRHCRCAGTGRELRPEQLQVLPGVPSAPPRVSAVQEAPWACSDLQHVLPLQGLGAQRQRSVLGSSARARSGPAR